MRTFVKLRQMLDSHAKLAKKLAGLEAKYDEPFRVVFEVLIGILIIILIPPSFFSWHVMYKGTDNLNGLR